MNVHEPCGAEVVMVLVADGEAPTVSTTLWGTPVLVDRRMLSGGGRLELVFHRCRNYVDWYRAVPDRRDVDQLDLPADWQPRPPAPLLEPPPVVEVVTAA